MAKGNLFQGMGRGKVGDVVFSRLNGQQISRVRNRNPKNPRSNAQLYQRAVMATAMRAYAAGAEIFDHSFQGKSVGAANQREFLRLNAKMLRSALAEDVINNPSYPVSAFFNAPGTKMPVPNRYIVSTGSLRQNLFVIRDPYVAQTGQSVQGSIGFGFFDESISLREFLALRGVSVGDIFTIVGFVSDSADNIIFDVGDLNPGALQMAGDFFFVRLIVKGDYLDDILFEMPLSHIFEVDSSFNVDWSRSFDFDEVVGEEFAEVQINNVFGFADNNYQIAAFGVIRSKQNSYLRSFSQLHWAFYDNRTGISPAYVLKAWKMGTVSLGESDLILEGGGFQPAPAANVESSVSLSELRAAIKDDRNANFILWGLKTLAGRTINPIFNISDTTGHGDLAITTLYPASESADDAFYVWADGVYDIFYYNEEERFGVDELLGIAGDFLSGLWSLNSLSVDSAGLAVSTESQIRPRSVIAPASRSSIPPCLIRYGADSYAVVIGLGQSVPSTNAGNNIIIGLTDNDNQFSFAVGSNESLAFDEGRYLQFDDGNQHALDIVDANVPTLAINSGVIDPSIIAWLLKYHNFKVMLGSSLSTIYQLNREFTIHKTSCYRPLSTDENTFFITKNAAAPAISSDDPADWYAVEILGASRAGVLACEMNATVQDDFSNLVSVDNPFVPSDAAVGSNQRWYYYSGCILRFLGMQSDAFL